MPEPTPTQPLQEIPRTGEVSYIRLMQRIRASINSDLPPLMVRTSHGILVAHQVSEERVNDTPFWRGYIPSLIGYVGLGPEKYLMWLTVQHCFRGKWLVIRVPDQSGREAYISDFAKELHALQVKINKMPLPLIPLWMIFDIVTSGLTPPGNETLIGTTMTYIVAFLWSKKLRSILHKIKLGRVEFVTAPHLRDVEALLMQGKYSEAIEELDRSDNTPRESPANNRFTSENLHLAELIQLGKQHDIEDHISQRIKEARIDLKERLLRKKSASLRSFASAHAQALTETQ